MADTVETITLEILKSIQASIAQFRAETNERLDRLETGMRKDRRNVAGMLVMMEPRPETSTSASPKSRSA